MSDIRNIIFDLGNVIIDLDFNRVNQAFQQLTGTIFQQLASAPETRSLFDRYEVGAIEEVAFVHGIQQLAGKKIPQEDIIWAWNAMLVGFPPHRFALLERLRQKYRLFLLSNTNTTHLDWVYRDLKETHGISDFDDRFFEKSYYSHLIQLRKPNVEIYQWVTADAGILPSETLFIDDTAENILGAQQAGLMTIHHDSGKDIEVVLQEAGIL